MNLDILCKSMKNIWRIGSNWGNINVLNIFKEHNIAFVGEEVEETVENIEIGDVACITKGKTIMAVGVIIGLRPLSDFIGNKASEFENVNAICFKKLFFSSDYPDINFKIYDGQGKQLHKAGNLYSKQILNTFKSVMKINQQNEIKEILEYKNQIILQGPPGTGKTRMAKEISRKLTLPSKIDKSYILNKIKIGQIVQMVSDSPTNIARFKILSINEENLEYERQSTNKIAKLNFSEIIEAYQNMLWLNIKNGSDPYSAPIAKFIYDNFESENVKLIQFHPAYSYEDFVRGISVEVNNSVAEYITKNKILADFAQKANTNYIESKKAPEQLSEERWLTDEIKKFAEIVEDEILNKGTYILNGSVSIFAVDDDCFRYAGNNWDLKNKYRMKFTDIIQAQINNVQDRQDFKKLRKIGIISGRSWQHSSYDLIVLKKFRDYLGERKAPMQVESVKLENYVLIIDEINRANLPAVLGELIYALEYRNHPVESMYDLDGDNKLTLPPNLYIIGTMNTADRSVGHIDYAIRRRFAFIDVLPSTEPIRSAGKEYFKTVSSLFIKNYDQIDWSAPKLIESEHLASDFRPEDVWLGHSYFITKEKDENGKTLDENHQMSIKLKFEIVPILKEYLKDGILNKSAKPIIDGLS
jgi:hypothetical protein